MLINSHGSSVSAATIAVCCLMILSSLSWTYHEHGDPKYGESVIPLGFTNLWITLMQGTKPVGVRSCCNGIKPDECGQVGHQGHLKSKNQ